MRETAIEALTTLEPIAMMVTYLAIAWMFMPLLQRQPAWLLLLIISYPIVVEVRVALNEPTWANILVVVLLAVVLPIAIIARKPKRGPPWPG